jgi:hypothetical protein
MANPGKLTARQEKAIACLLTEATLAGAAARADVPERTLRRWRTEPAFKAEVLQRRRDLVERAQLVLQHMTAEAALALRRALSCGKAAVEVRAAVAVLEQAVKGIESQELLERVEQLEEMLREKRP